LPGPSLLLCRRLFVFFSHRRDSCFPGHSLSDTGPK
jgi:hypothetical protein